MLKKSLFLDLLIVIVCIAACKKTGTPAPAKFTGCRIATITEVPADTTTIPRTTYRFYYNNDGTVQHIYAYIPLDPSSSYYSYYQSQSHYTYFAYSGNIIQVRMVYGTQTTPSLIDTITVDDQKRVVSISSGESYYYSGPLILENYWYDSTGDMYLHTTSREGMAGQSMDSAYWQGGDITAYLSYNIGGLVGNKSYSYYDTLYNTGNITANLADFENYGRGIFSSKHLVKRTFDSFTDSTKTYSYLLDASGKITNISETLDGGGVNTTQITYNCE